MCQKVKALAKRRDGHLQAPATVPCQDRPPPGRFFTGGCMGFRVGLDAMEKVDSPTPSLVTVPTELPRLTTFEISFAFFFRILCTKYTHRRTI
jgi:hypothetical protein